MQHDAPKVTPPDANPPTSPAATRSISPYVAVWAGLAVVALAYISIAIARPDFLGTTASDAVRTAENNQANRSQTSTETELEQKLARMEQDLQTSQASTSQDAAEKKSHLDRIAALEAKAAKAEAEAVAKAQGMAPDLEAAATLPVTPEAAAANANKKAADEIADRLAGAKILNDADAAKDAAENSTTVLKQTAQAAAENKVAAVATQAATKSAAEVVEITKAAVDPATKPNATEPAAKKQEPTKVAVSPKPKPAPEPIAKKKPSEIKTGSVGNAATKPITFGPAVVTRATRPIGVRIATGPSVDSLRLSWNALADRHGAPLKRLEPRYVTGIGATGLTYDLIAGPFNTANEASEVCARLHANGARCALGEFTGNAL